MRAVNVLMRDNNFVFRRKSTQLPPGLCACTHPCRFRIPSDEMACEIVRPDDPVPQSWTESRIP
jgi:hypothetical protein